MRIENSRIAVRRVETPMLSRNSSAPNVVAQPINMYVPTDLSLNSDVQSARQNARIGGLLRELAGNTVRIAGAKYQENVKEDTLRGMQDANERLEMDSSRVGGFLHSEEAYKRGYRATEDEARAIDLKTQFLEQLKQNNYFLDDPNPRARTDALYKETYQNVFNEEYMNSNERNGAMSESGILMAKQALLEGEEAYNKAYIEDRKTKLLNSTSTLVNYYVDSMFDKGELNPMSFQETMNSISAQTRESEGGSWLSPNELATFVVSRAGDKMLASVNEGNFKKADAILYSLRGLRGADGTLLYDTVVGSNPKTGAISMPYKDMMDNLEAQSIKAKEEYRRELEKQQEKARENNLASIMKGVADISLIPDNGARLKAQYSLLNTLGSALKQGAIDPVKGAKLYANVAELTHSGGYAQVSDPNVANQAWLDATKLGGEEFMAKWGNNPNLSKNDIWSLANAAQKNSDVDTKIGLGKGTITQEYLSKQMKELEDAIKFKTIDNKISNITDAYSIRQANKAYAEYMDYKQKAAQEGRQITYEEAQLFADSLWSKYVPEPDTTGVRNGNTKNQSAGGGGAANTPANKPSLDEILKGTAGLTQGKYK